MKKNITLYAYYGILLFTPMLLWKITYADLDGTITPIILTSKYTFTDGETAKGFVSFQDGFDLPFNGTINLELAPGMIIEGAITFNNGTLNAMQTCEFGPKASWQGPGFFQCNSDSAIIVSNDMNIRQKFSFLGDVTFLGKGFPEIFLRGGGIIDLALPNLSSCIFENIDLIIFGRLLTTSNNNLVFNQCNIRIGSNFQHTFFSNVITLNKTCRLQTSGPNGVLRFAKELVIGRGIVHIASQSYVEVEKPSTNSSLSQLILDNAILNIKSSTTNDIIFGDPVSTLHGRFSVNGQSILRSTTTNNIIIPRQLEIEFFSGSRLIIDTGTKLTIL